MFVVNPQLTPFLPYHRSSKNLGKLAGGGGNGGRDGSFVLDLFGFC